MADLKMLNYDDRERGRLSSRPRFYVPNLTDFGRASLILGTFVFAVAVTAQVSTAETLTPIGDGVEGNSSANAAFHPFANAFTLKTQQIWDAGLFGGDEIAITGIGFRLDGGTPSNVVASLPSVSISFGVTSTASTTMTTSFASNQSGALTEVYSETNVAVNATAGSSPNAFDILFEWTDGFEYDPASGNLLMQLVTAGSSGFGDLDATGSPQGQEALFGVGAGSTSGFQSSNDGFGLIAQFIVETNETAGGDPSPGAGTAVPLPAGAWLLIGGLAGLGVVSRRRRSPGA
ncbi:MAG: VPLPA-CTERM sorting domain-containing protein [Pseudomonadota bacterium]